MIRKLTDRILYGGTTKLTPLEKSLLEAAFSTLPSSESSGLRGQFENLKLIQKLHGNKSIEYHFAPSADPFVLPNHPKGEEITFLKFCYSLDGDQYSSNLIMWEGIVNRLETRKGIPKPLLKKSANQCVCKVSKTIEKTLADEMDEEEHGSNSP